MQEFQHSFGEKLQHPAIHPNFSTKSATTKWCLQNQNQRGPHFKIRIPLQNPDPDPLSKYQNNIKNPKNKASTKWSFITQGQELTNFRLLLETQVPDIVEQFRVADRWTRRLFWGFFLEKKRSCNQFCRELARSEFCWTLIL